MKLILATNSGRAPEQMHTPQLTNSNLQRPRGVGNKRNLSKRGRQLAQAYSVRRSVSAGGFKEVVGWIARIALHPRPGDVRRWVRTPGDLDVICARRALRKRNTHQARGIALAAGRVNPCRSCGHLNGSIPCIDHHSKDVSPQTMQGSKARSPLGDWSYWIVHRWIRYVHELDPLRRCSLWLSLGFETRWNALFPMWHRRAGLSRFIRRGSSAVFPIVVLAILVGTVNPCQ